MIKLNRESKRPQKETQIEFAVNEYLAGKSHKFEEIAKYVEPIMKQVLNARCYPGVPENEQDIRQEFWIETLKNLPKWKAEKGTLKNYLFKCFINRASYEIQKLGKSQKNLQFEEIEEMIPADPRIPNPADLDIEIKTRINGFKEELLFRKVWMATYLKAPFAQSKARTKELQTQFGLSYKRIRFLIDYAMLTLRKHYLEAGWKLNQPD